MFAQFELPFDLDYIRGANVTRVGSKTSCSVNPSSNKAERTAIAETLEGKLLNNRASSSSDQGRPRKEAKTKKARDVIS